MLSISGTRRPWAEIMTSGAEPFYTVIIAIVIMTIAGLSLWMSPVIA